ncbi:helix-turn-helix transcriptional regulator [Streptomyces sp. NPDC047085]|uniref:helix-turn-helix transcriptional regulator n=1 Tax=Streptomyces sp. NPDC047085 TaxID=3155140 RepID=UPI0033CF37A4
MMNIVEHRALGVHVGGEHDEREVALTELRTRLDDALASEGLTKTQLAARSGLGRTTVQAAFQPGGPVPSAATVAALAGKLSLQVEQLLELRRAAAGETGPVHVRDEGLGKPIGQWDPHEGRAERLRTAKSSELLQVYLHAASEIADKHPTPGLARWTVPSFAEVYQLQRSTGSAALDANDSEAATHADGAPLHPSTVLQGGNCLVVAGPGGGKSSLLHAVLLEGLRSHAPEVPVPVLVPARALADTNPLPQVIAQHVEKEVGALSDKPPGLRGLFAARPRPDTPWLLLVDGLDEIIDPALRMKVMAVSAAWPWETHRSTASS